MRKAFMARDEEYDGLFLVGVTTTGIFCRPSCPARRPRADHVRFFADATNAADAGYRPCRRCDPLRATGVRPAWVARLVASMERSRRKVTDRDLERAGLNPVRVRRYFRKHFGMTFQAYARKRRLGGALDQLRRGRRLDEVIMDNGFESHSGFREAFTRTFGQPPGRGRDVTPIVCTWMDSPLGPIIAGATGDRLCLLEFSGAESVRQQIESIRARFKRPAVPGESPLFDRLKRELTEYFAGTRKEFSIPLVTAGTPFEERVWSQLLRIPFGTTCSYEQLAASVGAHGAQRAVGSANGRNRIAILIPCHRVINKSGKLGGYGGELWRKEALLHLEKTGTMTTEGVATLPFEGRPSRSIQAR
ncbi:MAG TPA: methylated-DNA--[protein]-cysteine S-methyltransferase [Vicinamibacterales bacterium]|nr:methylated-DNA--[protein]-cysteine S-methyltransferase [Vicinamibacterales bacterium]